MSPASLGPQYILDQQLKAMRSAGLHFTDVYFSGDRSWDLSDCLILSNFFLYLFCSGPDLCRLLNYAFVVLVIGFFFLLLLYPCDVIRSLV